MAGLFIALSLLATSVGNALRMPTDASASIGLPVTLEAPVTELSGRLVAADGRPIAVSHVHLQGYVDGAILASVRVGPDGGWTLAADTTGLFLLWFSGVGYRGERVGLLLSGEEPAIELEARLARHEILPRPWQAELIGDFNEFRTDQGGIFLRSRTDGSLAAEVASGSDSIAVQLKGVAVAAEIELPDADRYVYDGAGGYRGVIDAAGPFAAIALDPGRIPAGDGIGEVTFTDPDSESGRFGRFSRDLFARVDAYFAHRARSSAAGATLTQMRAIYEEYDPAPDAAMLASYLAVEADPFVRDLMLTTYMGAPIKTDRTTARKALDEIPPGSRAWRAQPRGLSEALSASADPDRAHEYALALLAEPAWRSEQDASVRSTALGWLMEDALGSGRPNELAAYHAWLTGEYAGTRAAERAAALYAPDRKIQPGNRIPDFSVRSMDDAGASWSRDGLEGQVVMLDFWATWCGPCITEMPYLHAAYEDWRDAGFTILSLSFDLAPEDVENFRAEGDWPMPWLHTYVEDGADSDLAKELDVVNIPRAILIGRDGTILATNEALRGEKLELTLARVFEREN
ncbi:MAG: TlpA family protein disulfide reductase [marine benthic group bacterium]|nr:TlpA family protein disulfide reductase [Gemmatimonadota bacterium]